MHSTNPIKQARAPADPASGRHRAGIDALQQTPDSGAIVTAGISRAHVDCEKLKVVQGGRPPRKTLHVE
jgi:hypothetical protein